MKRSSAHPESTPSGVFAPATNQQTNVRRGGKNVRHPKGFGYIQKRPIRRARSFLAALLFERGRKRFTNPSVGLLEGKGTVSPTELARREPPTEETAIVDRSQSGVRLRHVWFVSP